MKYNCEAIKIHNAKVNDAAPTAIFYAKHERLSNLLLTLGQNLIIFPHLFLVIIV